jgi:hypothetical protein
VAARLESLGRLRLATGAALAQRGRSVRRRVRPFAEGPRRFLGRAVAAEDQFRRRRGSAVRARPDESGELLPGEVKDEAADDLGDRGPKLLDEILQLGGRGHGPSFPLGQPLGEELAKSGSSVDRVCAVVSQDDPALVPVKRHSVGLIDTRPIDAGGTRNPVNAKPGMVRVVGEKFDATGDCLSEASVFLASRSGERFGDVYVRRSSPRRSGAT